MSDGLPTAVGLPVLGLLILALGWWSVRHLDVLVGTVGSEDVLDRRRQVMGRGAWSFVVAGVILLVGGVVAAVAVLR